VLHQFMHQLPIYMYNTPCYCCCAPGR